MARSLLVALVSLLLLASSAAAALITETVASGQVTATFSYDARTSRSAGQTYRDLRVTLDRAGVRLIDEDVEDGCRGCVTWPAAAGSDGTKSIKLRDLDSDGEPELLVDLYSGGANCCWYSISWRYDEDRNVYVKKTLRPGNNFAYVLRDLDRDGAPEFRSFDYRFAYKYGSNLDTPRPLRIFAWDRGRLVDETIAFKKLASREAAQLYRQYLRLRKDRDFNVRGVLAAYLADSYNAGNGRVAWRRVVAAYRRGDVDKRGRFDSGPYGREYLKSLRRFLRKTGYLRA